MALKVEGALKGHKRNDQIHILEKTGPWLPEQKRIEEEEKKKKTVTECTSNT
jgi:hypothetical protein